MWQPEIHHPSAVTTRSLRRSGFLYTLRINKWIESGASMYICHRHLLVLTVNPQYSDNYDNLTDWNVRTKHNHLQYQSVSVWTTWKTRFVLLEKPEILLLEYFRYGARHNADKFCLIGWQLWSCRHTRFYSQKIHNMCECEYPSGKFPGWL